MGIKFAVLGRSAVFLGVCRVCRLGIKFAVWGRSAVFLFHTCCGWEGNKVHCFGVDVLCFSIRVAAGRLVLGRSAVGFSTRLVCRVRILELYSRPDLIPSADRLMGGPP